MCHVCGSNEPGLNATWTHQTNGSLCGPCASLRNCPSCSSSYSEGELIIQCQQCAQWLHAACDLIRNEREAEFCAEEGYTCLLCRPADQQPPHLNPLNAAAMALVNNLAEKSEKGLAVVRLHHRQELLSSCSSPPSPISTVDDRINGSRPKSSASQSQFLLDGICLSEGGMNYLRSLQMDQPRRRCRAKNKAQSLESADGDLKDDAEDGDSLFKDGTLLTPREDGRMPDVPEGYTVVQGENGALILRKKRQRNMQKLGIGGFKSA